MGNKLHQFRRFILFTLFTFLSSLFHSIVDDAHAKCNFYAPPTPMPNVNISKLNTSAGSEFKIEWNKINTQPRS